MTFSLSPGQAHDAPEGRKLLDSLDPKSRPIHLLMDRAYEGNETRQAVTHPCQASPFIPQRNTRHRN